MNILLSCVGRRSYMIDYFREALRRSDIIMGTSNSEWAPALRYCDKTFYMPAILADSYIDAMLQLCRDEKVDVLLSFLDPDVHVLAQHYEDFTAMGVLPILPKPAASTVCFDKLATAGFLQAHGFRAPKTYENTVQVNTALVEGRLSFPVIVKPRFGFASKNVFRADDVGEMENYVQHYESMIIQEMLQGEELDLDICNDIHGQEVLAVVPWKKVASRAGEVEAAVTIDNADLLAIGARLGRLVGQAGPMDVDVFKVRNEYHILELNPRFGGGYAVSHLAGADYPGMLVRMIRGERVAPRIGEYQRDVVMMKEYKIACGSVSGISSHYVDGNHYG